MSLIQVFSSSLRLDKRSLSGSINLAYLHVRILKQYKRELITLLVHLK